VSDRVFVTGAGVVCAAGHELDGLWERLATGASALAPIRRFDASVWVCARAGEVTSLDARALVPERKLHKLIRRCDMFGLYAADRAIAGAGWDDAQSALSDDERTRYLESTGAFVASGGGGYEDQYDFLPLLHACDGQPVAFGAGVARSVAPMWLLRSLPNNVLCHTAIRHGFRGPNSCIVNHSAGGAQALLEAASVLRAGRAERAVAVAHEAPVEPQRVHYYASLGLLARDALRPFDRRHDGSLLGEGGAALALESAAAARDRGAAPLGEFLAGACASEATGVFAVRDDGAGVEAAIRLALERAAISSHDVGLIVAHGNGTPRSDVSEARALERVFAASMPPVTGFKWAFGHTLAASALLDAALALESLRRGAIPAVATLEECESACAALAGALRERAPRSDIALVISRGFAGNNAALLLRSNAASQAPSPKSQA